MKKVKNLLALLLAALSPMVYAQKNPGGVSGSTLWYRADKNSVSSGGNLTSWTDYKNNITAAQMGANALPLFQTGSFSYFNFNPGVKFTNTGGNNPLIGNPNQSVLGQSIGNENYTSVTNDAFDVFTVSNKITNAAPQYNRVFSIANDPTRATNVDNWDFLGIYPTGQTERRGMNMLTSIVAVPPSYDANIPSIMYYNNFVDNGGFLGASRFNMYKALNGNAQSTNTSFNNYWTGHTNKGFAFGDTRYYRSGSYNGSDNGGFVGDISETIVFGGGNLSATDRRKVESYLGIKYGLTLGQLNTLNYVATDNSVFWNGATNTTYNKNVFGVGRDDAEDLMQNVSVSANNAISTNEIKLVVATSNDFTNPNENTSRRNFTNNLTYFMLGDNGNTTKTPLTTVNNGFTTYQKMQRTWLSQRKNTSETLYFQIDLTGYTELASLSAGQSIVMLIADNDTFTTNLKVVSGANVGGKWVFANNFDGDATNLYISFAKTSTITCTTGCNDNTYVNAVDPNTIEYDNIIGLYHSTMAKEADGTIKIWGQGAAYNGTGTTGNILTPQVINSTNYPGLTGDILKFAGASRGNNQQFAVLTTTGMFVWGDTDILVPTGVKNSNIFGSIAVGTYGVAGTKADGLPAGVAPGDVKMMFGTERALSIVTCSGEAWMLSRQGYLYGDGTTDNSANDIVWHRVSTAAGVPLTNVVAARGAYYGMMALTFDGEIYTWGRQTRLGNNTTPEDRLYATLMDKPNGITPKMIGMTFVYDNTTSTNELTYYLLATNGNLYSMGGNKSRQLGNGTTTASDSWINVTATDKGASLGGNIVWISPNEHDSNNGPAINVLTTNGKLWAWGDNSFGMLDGNSSNSSINPTYMPGSITGAYDKGKLNLTDKLIAVETGGHTTITIKECSTKFGYLGHRIHGSMADGTNETGVEHNYNFNNTSELSICGALTGPIVEDLEICFGQTANLADAVPGALPPGITIEWWTTIDKQPGTQVTNTSSVPAGTYYAFYVGANPVGIACPSVITIDNAACACYKPGLTTGGDVLDTKVGITSLSRAGADNPDNWPMIRKGGHIALESKEKAFVPNRVAFEDADSDPATPDVPVGIPAADFIEGMMMYDTTNQCLKVYTLKAGDTQMAWHCMTTQACPD